MKFLTTLIALLGALALLASAQQSANATLSDSLIEQARACSSLHRFTQTKNVVRGLGESRLHKYADSCSDFLLQNTPVDSLPQPLQAEVQAALASPTFHQKLESLGHPVRLLAFRQLDDSDNSTDDNPCAASPPVQFNVGFHVGSIFVILFASGLGAILPILGRHSAVLAVHPFALVCGKCAGIGIILSCALVHLLQPGNEELSDGCLNYLFSTEYSFAYLFSLIAILVMQLIDFLVDQFVTAHFTKKAMATLDNDPDLRAEVNLVAIAPGKKLSVEAPSKTADVSPSPSPAPYENKKLIPDTGDDSRFSADKPSSPDCVIEPICDADSIQVQAVSVENMLISPVPSIPAEKFYDTKTQLTGPNVVIVPVHTEVHKEVHYHHHDDDLKKNYHGDTEIYSHSHAHSHVHMGEGGHSHAHSVLFIQGIRRTLSAYLLEFGVATHSILIGLTTGIADDPTLDALLVALVFHQLFEGIALGSRIAEAKGINKFEEIMMVAIFAFSAPLGMAIGVGIQSTLNTNGSGYNYTAGTFDSICSGILLWLGLNLLIQDFPADMIKYAGNDNRKKFLMYAFMWAFAGILSYIGLYL